MKYSLSYLRLLWFCVVYAVVPGNQFLNDDRKKNSSLQEGVIKTKVDMSKILPRTEICLITQILCQNSKEEMGRPMDRTHMVKSLV